MLRNPLQKLGAFADRCEQSLGLLLLLSGVIGAALGIAGATFQGALEPAQLLMGSVTYDPGSTVYGMHMTMFTLVNYVLWPLLALTNSEVVSSIILCALIGIVAMQCLAMAIFIGVRNVYIAFLASIVAALWHLYGYGIAYPILLVGSSHTNGRIGFFFPLFAILLFAFSRIRLAFFLCGLSLLVHPSWGLWIAVCIFLVLVTSYRQVKPLVTARNIGAYFAGVGLSALAIVLHKIIFPIPAVAATTGGEPAARELFYDYIRYWDYHRQRFDNPGILQRELFYAAITLTLSIMIAVRRNTSAGKKLFARIMIVATILSAVLVFIPSWFPPDAFPQSLISLMPGRFINIPLFVAIPMLIGYLLEGKKTIPSLVTAAFCWVAAYYLRRFIPLEIPIPRRELAIVVAALGYAGYAYARKRVLRDSAGSYTWTNRILAPAAFAAVIVSPPYFIWHQIPQIRANFTAVSIPPGVKGKVLATFENYLLQAQSRVPTITPVIDGYAYSKSAALIGLNRELSDIYGVSLANPPRTGNTHRGAIVTSDYEQLWESRSCTDWERLAKKYNFGLIVTPPDLNLQLPRADNDRTWNKFLPHCKPPSAQ